MCLDTLVNNNRCCSALMKISTSWVRSLKKCQNALLVNVMKESDLLRERDTVLEFEIREGLTKF